MPNRLELGKAVIDALLSKDPDARRMLVARLFSDPDGWPHALGAAGRLAGTRAGGGHTG